MNFLRANFASMDTRSTCKLAQKSPLRPFRNPNQLHQQKLALACTSSHFYSPVQIGITLHSHGFVMTCSWSLLLSLLSCYNSCCCSCLCQVTRARAPRPPIATFEPSWLALGKWKKLEPVFSFTGNNRNSCKNRPSFLIAISVSARELSCSGILVAKVRKCTFVVLRC